MTTGQRFYKEAEGFDALRDLPASVVGSVDTETTGLDCWDLECFVLCSSHSLEDETAFVVRYYREVPLASAPHRIWVRRRLPGRKVSTPVQIGLAPMPDIRARVEGLCAFVNDPRVKVVGHSVNFDRGMVRELCRRVGVPEPEWSSLAMDTQAAAAVLDENLFNQADLAYMVGAFTHMDASYDAEFKRDYGYEDMPGVPLDRLLRYAGGDADGTRRTAVAIAAHLKKPDGVLTTLGRYYVHVAHPVVKFALYEIERNGTYIDMGALPFAKAAVAGEIIDLERRALALLPGRVRSAHKEKGLKLSRPSLLQDALFSPQGWGLRPPKKTDKGNASTDKEARQALLDDPATPPAASEFLEVMGEWSRVSKLFSTYLTGFEAHVKYDGRVHGRYSLARARTGRVTSSDPDLQNIPKRGPRAHVIRRLVATPSGRVLVSVDYSQSDVRWAAQVSGDLELVRIFQAGEDVHSATAQMFVDRPLVELSDAEVRALRESAKPLNFGLLFLMTPWGLRRHAFREYGVSWTAAEAARWHAAWHAKHPGIGEYHRRTIEFCRRHGYVESPLGRQRRLPDINSSDPRKRFAAERQAVNQPIQEPSSSMGVCAMSDIVREKRLDPQDGILVNVVHDDVIAECRDDPEVIYRVVTTIKEAMRHPRVLDELGIELKVPLEVEAKVGKNLAEMKKWEGS